MNRTILLNKRPIGKPLLSDFKFVSEEKPEIETGEILLKTSYVSVDPYLRGRMSEGKSYVAPFELPKKGETLVVSGAAGAVGSVVGQIGKIIGCRVVGIAGTEEKVEMLKSDFDFDAAINYNTTSNMRKAIAAACPDGVDVYFDNVGGSISDAVLVKINKFARIIVCGVISIYNETSLPKSLSVQPFLIKSSALMQGFIVNDYAAKFPKAMIKLSQWLAEGKLTNTETIVEGFDQIPLAFMDLFEGKNKGKMVVKV